MIESEWELEMAEFLEMTLVLGYVVLEEIWDLVRFSCWSFGEFTRLSNSPVTKDTGNSLLNQNQLLWCPWLLMGVPRPTPIFLLSSSSIAL